MPFTDLAFLCLAVPPLLAVLRLSPVGRRPAVMLLASLPALALAGIAEGAVLLALVLGTWGIGRAMAAGRAAAALCALGGAANGAALLWAGGWPLGGGSPALPVAALAGIGWLVDVRRGAAPGGVLGHAAWRLSLLPLTGGIPLREGEGRFGPTAAGPGAKRALVGLALLACVALPLAPLAAAALSQPVPSLADAWVGAAAFMLGLYAGLAGAAAMAIGLGQVVGLRLPEVFAAPFLTADPRAFWRGWLVPVGAVLRDALAPLRRRGEIPTLAALALAGGLVLGGGLMALAFAAWQFGLLALHALWRRAGRPLPALLAHPLLLAGLLPGFALLGAAGPAEGLALLGAMAGAGDLGPSEALLTAVAPEQWAALGLGGLAAYGPAVLAHAGAPGPLRQAIRAVAPLLAGLIGLAILAAPG